MSEDKDVKELYGIPVHSGGHTHAFEHLGKLTEHELHQLVKDVEHSHEHHGLFAVPHDGHVLHFALKKQEDGGYKIHEAPHY